jgi:hypothetical protein
MYSWDEAINLYNEFAGSTSIWLAGGIRLICQV